jgi:hypothetical protein
MAASGQALISRYLATQGLLQGPGQQHLPAQPDGTRLPPPHLLLPVYRLMAGQTPMPRICPNNQNLNGMKAAQARQTRHLPSAVSAARMVACGL